MRKLFLIAVSLLLSISVLVACVKDKNKDYGLDYLILVNKLNPLPDDYEDKVLTVHMINSIGDDVEVEVKAYDAYLNLKKQLEEENIYVDLDSARRSIAAQQKIVDDFTEKYGADYTSKVVATPGYSEHHTGLALDLYLIVDGKEVIENEDLVTYPKIWDKIFARLAENGFILRYLQGKEHITGYAYEPWHIRYIDDVEVARKIMDRGITLEAYLNKVNETDVDIDYASSDIYTNEQLDDAFIKVKCKFATMSNCELHSLRYAGDDCNTKENLDWLNTLIDDGSYVKIIEILSDFNTLDDGFSTLEPNKEYKDYQWWLAYKEDGSLDIVSFEY